MEGLADPATAGTGAFGGVLSTPYGWVWLSITVTLLCGCVLGIASVKLAGLIGRLFSSDRSVAEPEVEVAHASVDAPGVTS